MKKSLFFSKNKLATGTILLTAVVISFSYYNRPGGIPEKKKSEEELCLAGEKFADASFDEKLAWSQMDDAFNSSNQVLSLSAATSIGPTNVGAKGARIKSSWVDQGNSSIVIAGGETGGIWRSTNYGSSWISCTPNNSLSFDVNDITQDPTNNNIYYYAANDGTTDINDLDELGSASLIYKSTDRGLTWSLLSNIQTGITGTIRDIEHVNGSATFYFGAGNKLYKSTTGGAGYSLIHTAVGYITDIEIFPDGHIIFSAGKPGTLVYISSAASPDVFTSQTGAGRIPSTATRIEMDYCMGSPQYVYALVQNSNARGEGKDFAEAYKSINGGSTWTICDSIKTYGGTAYWDRKSDWHFSILAHPLDPLKVAIASVEFTVTTNGGTSWNYNYSAGYADVNSIAQNKLVNDSFYTNTDGGLYAKSWANPGAVAARNNNMSIYQAYGGYYFPQGTGGTTALIAGFQDRHTLRYFNNAWSNVSLGDGGTSNYIIQGGTNAGNVGFGRMNSYNYRYRNLNGSPSSTSILTTLGWQAHTIDVNETNESQVYMVDLSNLYRSTNYGVNNSPVVSLTMGLNQCWVNNESDPCVYISSNQGTPSSGILRVLKTAATNPVSLNITNIPETDKRIKSITCHPTDPNIIYVVKENSGKVYRLTNAKTSTPVWTDITPNIANVFMRALWVEVNPVNPNNLYLGTYFGLYYSNDGGISWFKYTGIPNVRIPQLRLRASDNKLFVFTYGRGVWTIDVTPSPIVNTNAAGAITTRTATLNGTVDANNSNTTVTFQYGTSTSYGTTVNASPITVTGTNNTPVTAAISNLTDNQTYHFRTVGTNATGDIVYGADQQFTTLLATIPTVTTTVASSITNSSAVSGGNVISDGGANVTSKGVCWSTNPNPTILDAKTVNGSGTGSFTSSLSPLNPGTLYYYRAYATNSKGTSYGNNLNFPTPANQAYCAISGTNNTNKYISQITLEVQGSGAPFINNTSLNNVNGYGDYTNISGSVAVGTNYTLKTYFVLNQSSYLRVFIDYNQNAIFESSDQVYDGSKLSGGLVTINIPSTAANGSTRMRIMLSNINNPLPSGSCGTITNGEAEDYTLNISGGMGRIAENVTPRLNIYPNPVNNKLYFDTNYKGEMTLTIYNLNGQQLYAGMSESPLPLDVHNLPAGSYILQITGNGFDEKKQFIKE